MSESTDDITAEIAAATTPGASTTTSTSRRVRKIPTIIVDRPPLTLGRFLRGLCMVVAVTAIVFLVLWALIGLNRRATIGGLRDEIAAIELEQAELEKGVSTGAMMPSDAAPRQRELRKMLAVRNGMLAEVSIGKGWLDTPYMKPLLLISLAAGAVFGLCWGRATSPRHGVTEIEVRSSPLRRRRIARTSALIPRER